jgi:hypothetical protein
MIDSTSPAHAISILGIELGLTVAVCGLAFVYPNLGHHLFSRVERACTSLARRRRLAVLTVGLSTFVLRLLILPLIPIPLPAIPDDFSFLFAANTFALGRLTNPTPKLWTHFETIHITMQPTWVSMYFPAQGLVLAAGKVLFGQPWYGQLIASAFMSAAICWMLQAWMPSGWALLGGSLAVLRLGVFSYWINSYSGGGLIAATGGALVLGSLPRLKKSLRLRDGVLMALGIVLLGFTRPYEGLLLCLPVAVSIVHWALFGKKPSSIAVVVQRASLPIALILIAVSWLAYYDKEAFGSPFTLPYTVDRATYAIAPYYVWQSRGPEPAYRHVSIRNFYHQDELKLFTAIHSPSRFIPLSLKKADTALLFFAGFALLPPIIMARRVLLDGRIRFLVICVAVLGAGSLIEVFMVPHYMAPFLPAFYAIGLQGMRHLRLWRYTGQPVGLSIVRLTVILCVVMAGIRLLAKSLNFTVANASTGQWTGMWYGPDRVGTEREQIQIQMDRLPGKQLLLVQYAGNRNSIEQWVYNDPDLESAKVVWANDMGQANNLELIDAYRDRKVWLVQMNSRPATVTPYLTPKP